MGIKWVRRWGRIKYWIASNEGFWGVLGLALGIIALYVAIMQNIDTSVEIAGHSKSLVDKLQANIDSITKLRDGIQTQTGVLGESVAQQELFVAKLEQLNHALEHYQYEVKNTYDTLAIENRSLQRHIASLRHAIAGDSPDRSSLSDIVRSLRQSSDNNAVRLENTLTKLQGVLQQTMAEGNKIMSRIAESYPVLTIGSSEYKADTLPKCTGGSCVAFVTSKRMHRMPNDSPQTIAMHVSAGTSAGTLLRLLVPLGPCRQQKTTCGIVCEDSLLTVRIGDRDIEPRYDVESGYACYEWLQGDDSLRLTFASILRQSCMSTLLAKTEENLLVVAFRAKIAAVPQNSQGVRFVRDIVIGGYLKADGSGVSPQWDCVAKLVNI